MSGRRLALVMLMAAVTLGARAQGAASLDAPMHPIDKNTATPSRCAKCPAADAKELDAQRVADRTAPEYAAARRNEMAMPESPAGVVVEPTPLPIPLPLR